ncbi:ABC transporter ATP-binding protein [Apilactobacillus xinyiensis]|uniref:ABC transporter ATP-binding protein n=1 Tax=Apilactobacillus xinyiensis TaxID=2841032 RepID=UPI00200CE879|nr:ATP-binding cassette domain-containing protein [Apilactobacillus xinyiensis]MCL0330811.1 ATP-binding cassette domain-containing protein [Apilactobacillus xinyiensis]
MDHEKFILETKSLTKQYGNNIGIDNVNIHLRKGHIYGLLGKNGSGKSTTMKIILGLIKPDSGSISLFGQKINRKNNEIYEKIGSTIEEPGFYPNLTGTENLKLFARLRNLSKKHVKDALEKLKLPYDDKKLFREYSLGMKQRLAIANAIMHKPKILILDEPTNGLDPEGIIDIRNLILNLSNNNKISILISSHILSEIQLVSDDIGIINNGNLLIESSLQELMNKDKNKFILKVSKPEIAKNILEKDLKLRNIKVMNNVITIYGANFSSDIIIKAFVKRNVDIYYAYFKKETLENHFQSLIDGRN